MDANHPSHYVGPSHKIPRKYVEADKTASVWVVRFHLVSMGSEWIGVLVVSGGLVLTERSVFLAQEERAILHGLHFKRPTWLTAWSIITAPPLSNEAHDTGRPEQTHDLARFMIQSQTNTPTCNQTEPVCSAPRRLVWVRVRCSGQTVCLVRSANQHQSDGRRSKWPGDTETALTHPAASSCIIPVFMSWSCWTVYWAPVGSCCCRLRDHPHWKQSLLSEGRTIKYRTIKNSCFVLARRSFLLSDRLNSSR